MKDSYERRLVEDIEASLEAAKKSLELYRKEGSVQTLYNVRQQSSQASQWASELAGARTLWQSLKSEGKL